MNARPAGVSGRGRERGGDGAPAPARAQTRAPEVPWPAWGRGGGRCRPGRCARVKNTPTGSLETEARSPASTFGSRCSSSWRADTPLPAFAPGQVRRVCSQTTLSAQTPAPAEGSRRRGASRAAAGPHGLGHRGRPAPRRWCLPKAEGTEFAFFLGRMSEARWLCFVSL